MQSGALSIQPKIPEISVGTSKFDGTEQSNWNIWEELWRWSSLTGLSFWSVGLKSLFPFDKIVVPNTTLLYLAYKNDNQTRGGLGWVCATGMYRSIGHVEFPKFQTRIFVKWKVAQV